MRGGSYAGTYAGRTAGAQDKRAGLSTPLVVSSLPQRG
jgi:hypothetical protein